MALSPGLAGAGWNPQRQSDGSPEPAAYQKSFGVTQGPSRGAGLGNHAANRRLSERRPAAIHQRHQPTPVRRCETPSLSEQVLELTKTNDFLLQELAYYRDTRTAEVAFWHKITRCRREMGTVMTEIDRALEGRSKARAGAEAKLLSHQTTSSSDGNIEDNVF